MFYIKKAPLRRFVLWLNLTLELLLYLLPQFHIFKHLPHWAAFNDVGSGQRQTVSNGVHIGLAGGLHTCNSIHRFIASLNKLISTNPSVSIRCPIHLNRLKPANQYFERYRPTTDDTIIRTLEMVNIPLMMSPLFRTGRILRLLAKNLETYKWLFPWYNFDTTISIINI
jgi:hypothetical protein